RESDSGGDHGGPDLRHHRVTRRLHRRRGREVRLGGALAGAARLLQRPPALGRHRALRPAHVRDDASVGHPATRRPATGGAGVRGAVAGDRQGGLLVVPGGVGPAYPGGAGVRPGGGPGHEGRSRPRPLHRRSRARGRGDPRRPGRPVRTRPDADHRRRRHPRAPRRRPGRPRPDGRAQLPERRGAAGVPPAPVGPRGTGARAGPEPWYGTPRLRQDEAVEELERVADRLYALPPQRFVTERDAAAAAARAAGDTATAAALRKLRRPTVAAWLVNLLALRRPEELADLTGLADELRAAQQELDGARLRELTARRRSVVSALVGQAQALAMEVAPEHAGKLPLAEVESTLGAALVDRDAADQVRSGRMVRAPAATGFGELPRARLRLVTSPPEAAPASGGPAGQDRDGAVTPAAEERPASRVEIEQEWEAARAALDRARAGLEAATAAERAAQEELE